MPEKYRGAALGAKLPPGAARPPAIAIKPAGPGKGLFLAALAVLLLVGVVAAVFLVPRKKAVPAPPQPSVNVNLPPAPVGAAEATTTPSEVATTTPEVATTTPEVAPAAPPEPAPDSDADGLTDIEENEIYQTDPNRLDTDNDGYLDGGEVFYLYNPAGVAPLTLQDSGLVRLFDDQKKGFSILVPKNWSEAAVLSGWSFNHQTEQLILVIVQEKPLALSLVDWYRNINPEVSPEAITSFKNRSGLDGIKSSDGLVAYFATSTKVYGIGYGSAGAPRISSYRRTLEMMINSFKFLAPLSTSLGATTSTPAGAATGTP